MQKRLSVVMLVMMLVGFVALIGCEAQAEGDAAVTVKGSVQVTRDEDYNATAATVSDNSKDPAVSYSIVLNAKGNDLADAMEGQETEITGTVAKKGEVNLLTVTSYKGVEVPEAAAAEPAPADEAEVEADEAEVE